MHARTRARCLRSLHVGNQVPQRMDNLFKEVTPLLTFLLPGFLFASIFYGFTSHPKPSQFERTVEALVFTFVVHAATRMSEVLLETIGRTWSVGVWTLTSQLACSVLIATTLGALMAAAVNKDTFHSWLRKKGLTSRSSHSSEWHGVLGSNLADVVLHLVDGRRLTGWPKEWPLNPHSGQFYIQDPAWIDDDGNAMDLNGLDGIIIQATDVRWVEVILGEGVRHGCSTQRVQSTPPAMEARAF
jgi:hypothetical protein